MDARPSLTRAPEKTTEEPIVVPVSDIQQGKHPEIPSETNPRPVMEVPD
jgi:hypothetical protein